MQISADNHKAQYNVTAFKNLVLVITGTWRGHIQIKYSLDGRVYTSVKSIPKNGTYTIDVSGYKFISITGVNWEAGTAIIQVGLNSNANSALAAYNILTFTGIPADDDSITIDGQAYPFQESIGIATAGVGRLTFTANGQNNDEIVMGANTYILKTALTEAAASGLITSDNTNPDDGGNIVVNDQTYVYKGTLTGAQASGSVTATNNLIPVDGEVTTIGDKIYRYKDILAQANDVKIGADGHATLDNLKAALDLSGTPGTQYHADTTANTQANAPQNPGNFGADWVLTIVAINYGVAGNAIVLTETATNIAVSGAGVLTGGIDQVANEILIGINADTTLGNLRKAINQSGTPGVEYSVGTVAPTDMSAGAVTAHTVTVTASTNGVAGNTYPFLRTASHIMISGSGTLENGADAVANEVKIGAALTNTLDNLVAAVNGDAGIGTTYSTGTVASAEVTAVKTSGTLVTITSVGTGDAQDSIVTTTTSANASWGAPALLMGEDAEAAFDVLTGATVQECIDNLIAAINLNTGEGTIYGTGTTVHPTVRAEKLSPTQIKVIAKTAGAAGNAIACADSGANFSWANATLVDGADSV